MSSRVLVVDDDPVQCRLLEGMLQKFGYEPLTLDNGDAAIELLGSPDGGRIDCVILDLVMPNLDGLGVLARLRQAGNKLPVIVQTAHGGIDNVVSAMRAGAIDFVVKPVGAERLHVSLRNALNTSALEGELARLKHSRSGTLGFADILTRSANMTAVIRIAEKAAASTIPVLISGESGVGKELIARAIHGTGERRSRPFVAVNCGAMPENLIEFDPVRPREGLVHRRHRAPHRKVRRSLRRDAVSRRSRRVAGGRAGQTVARYPGRRGRAGRRAQGRACRRAHHLSHQPRLDRRREGRSLPRRSVLPPACLPDRRAAAARAARRYSGIGQAFSGALCRRRRQAHPSDQAGGDATARGVPVARQYPAIGECAVSRRGAGRRGQRRDR